MLGAEGCGMLFVVSLVTLDRIMWRVPSEFYNGLLRKFYKVTLQGSKGT